MNTTHTPGPWSITGSEIRVKNGIPMLLATVNNSAGARLNGYNAEANARLIAAAPELLETVIELKKALSRMIDQYNPDSIEAEWIGNAHEVILKATDPNY